MGLAPSSNMLFFVLLIIINAAGDIFVNVTCLSKQKFLLFCDMSYHKVIRLQVHWISDVNYSLYSSDCRTALEHGIFPASLKNLDFQRKWVQVFGSSLKWSVAFHMLAGVDAGAKTYKAGIFKRIWVKCSGNWDAYKSWISFYAGPLNHVQLMAAGCCPCNVFPHM